MSKMTVAAEKFNTAFELNVQDVLTTIINSFVLDIIVRFHPAIGHEGLWQGETYSFSRPRH
jgi:hypothetical protein